MDYNSSTASNDISKQKNLELEETNFKASDEISNDSSLDIIAHNKENGNLEHWAMKTIFGEETFADCDFGNEEIDNQDSSMFNEMWDSLDNESSLLSKDDTPFLGKLISIYESVSHKESISTLVMEIDVNDNGIIKHIIDTTVFSKKQGYLYYEMKRLKEKLTVFGISKSAIGDINAKNVAKALQPFVGLRVKISQYKDGGYNKFRFHAVEKRRK